MALTGIRDIKAALRYQLTTNKARPNGPGRRNR